MITQRQLLSIGSDPELMLWNTKTADYVSAVGLLPGTKEMPHDIGNNCSIQTDNVNVEWCLPPTLDPHVMFDAIKYCTERTNEMLPQGIIVHVNSSHSFDQKHLQTPQALEFGCEPDFNAYTMKENPKPKSEDETLRTCGGHVHVGGENIPINFAIMLDLFLGLPSLLMDSDDKRRELYGKAGAFRPKPYGMEYRVLSNFWINDFDLVSWVMQNTQLALKHYDDYIIKYSEVLKNELESVINTNSKIRAKEIIDSLNIPVLIKETVNI